MIRPATATEARVVAAIERACFGADGWTEALVGDAIGSARHTVLLDGTDAYGAIAVAGDVADLERIAVMPSRRRRGVARGLLTELVAAARAGGATRVLLEVAADNPGAIAFYEAYGFAAISRRPGYYRHGADAIVMELDLGEGA